MLGNLRLPALVVAMGIALAGFMLPADIAYAQKEQFVRSKPHVNVGKKKESLYFPEQMLKETPHQAGRKQGGKWKSFQGGGLQVHTTKKNKPKLKADSPDGQAASGLPTGKRQHKPVSITKPVDQAAPSVLDRGPNNVLGGTGVAPGAGGSSSGANRLTR